MLACGKRQAPKIDRSSRKAEESIDEFWIFFASLSRTKLDGGPHMDTTIYIKWLGVVYYYFLELDVKTKTSVLIRIYLYKRDEKKKQQQNTNQSTLFFILIVDITNDKQCEINVCDMWQ